MDAHTETLPTQTWRSTSRKPVSLTDTLALFDSLSVIHQIEISHLLCNSHIRFFCKTSVFHLLVFKLNLAIFEGFKLLNLMKAHRLGQSLSLDSRVQLFIENSNNGSDYISRLILVSFP